MKIFNKSLFIYFVLFAALAQASTTLEGLIEIAEEDEKYKVTEVNLMVDKVTKKKFVTEYYRVDNKKGKGKELLELVDSKVKVRAKLRRGKGGVKLITVLDYEIVSSSDSDSYQSDNLHLSFPPAK